MESGLEERGKEEVILSSLAGLRGRIGILGGTFDPPHLAHVGLARAAAGNRQLDKVIFIPAARNPLKREQPLASDEDRLHMLYLALRGEENTFISPQELERGGPSYSCDTVRMIRKAAPGAGLFFIIGADCVPDLARWKDLAGLVSLVSLVVVSRQGVPQPDFDALRGAIPAGALAATKENFVKDFSMPHVASDLRDRIDRGQDVSEALHPEVYRYIREKGVYRNL